MWQEKSPKVFRACLLNGDEMLNINEINKTDALHYMGIRSCNDSRFLKEVDEIAQKLLEIYTPLFQYKKYSIEQKCNKIEVLKAPLVLEGHDIYEHLSVCDKVIFMACTIGFKVDNFIKLLQITDIKKAVIADALAGALIEQVCDKVEEIIRNENKDKNMTFRYSPGYGDFDISAQKSISDLLCTQENIGLYVNSSYMMTPLKSVIAVIGLY